jgi:2-succinyl-6-hydroxy-2,4-cyclohexadiene-1-carboxylate synthase
VLTRLNGLDFHVEVEGDGPPLVLLHGFTGSVRSWDEVRPRLSGLAKVIALDLIGHGRSEVPTHCERYSLAWTTRDLAALLDSLELDKVDLLGYSMGGRLALHFALEAPERVRRLVLESASPGIADDTERRQRAVSDDALARRILDHGVLAFVDEWELQPLLQPAPHVSSERRAVQRAQRLDNNPVGLANNLRGMGAGQQTPLWDRLSEVSRPVHLIVGQRDARYRQIAERMRQRLPAATLAVVNEAGHTVHVDQPRRFGDLVAAILDNKLTEPGGRC